MRRLLAAALIVSLSCAEDPVAPTGVATVTVSPAGVTLLTGDTARLVAVARNAGGDSLAGKPIAWTSSDSSVAAVSASGLVTARARGVATIGATAEGKVGEGIVTVVGRIATLTINVNGDTLFTGDSTFWSASGFDSAGNWVLGRPVSWSVADSSILRGWPIDYDVWLKGRAPGMTWVKATSEGVSDSARMWVRNRVGSVAIGPDTGTVLIGDTLRLGATVRDTAGTLLTDRRVTWVVLLGPATIDSTGLLRAVAGGSATVRAQSETKADTAIFHLQIAGRFKQIAAGDVHACGITTTGATYCWGNGWYGQLGIGGGNQGNVVTPTLVTGGLTFSHVLAGFEHACGLAAGGEADCWGLMSFGALGNAAGAESCTYGESCRGTPLPVTGVSSFTQLSAGDRRTCGIVTGGTAYCWGANYAGQLGTGAADGDAHPAPEAVSGGLAFTTITTGGTQTCGVAGGRAYCWGDNRYGQLGRGSVDTVVTPHATPDTVVGGHTFVTVTAGTYHTCGIASDGSAYCWGLNDVGELGTGASSLPVGAPVAVAGGVKFLTVAAATDHTCGIGTDSLAYCWGGNSGGQLGDGTTLAHFAPLTVSGGLKFVVLTVNRNFTCGVTTGDVAYCWGGNGEGRLGIGGFNQVQAVPARVLGQP